jgi:hypothetical protein
MFERPADIRGGYQGGVYFPPPAIQYPLVSPSLFTDDRRLGLLVFISPIVGEIIR